jgi:glycosyltransferase involved in cell wall biosynthesis
MRTAIVHDWLTGLRGGEKVLDLLCEILPASDLYTLIYVKGSVTPRIESHRIVTSWLDKLPGVRHYYRWLLPLMPSAISRFRLEGYDLVVAVSHCVAHGVRVSGGTRFVCYCLTPMRYVWELSPETLSGARGRSDARGGNRWHTLRYGLLSLIRRRFRCWDSRAAAGVGEYVSISRAVEERVRECYGRGSRVIPPPADVEFFRPAASPKDCYLWAGALAPYKRIDIAIDAFAELDRRLVVIGEGQDLRRARRRAGPNVTFLGRVPDDALREYYGACRALVFPGEEDFGIVPVEAQSCGRPVIAFGRGGVVDTVVPLGDASGRAPTGVFFDAQTPGALAEAVRRFEANESAFEPDAIRANAERFSRERCKAALTEYLLGPGRSPGSP